MKTIKSIILSTLMLTLCLPFFVSAQGGPKHKKHEQRFETMKSELELSDQQIAEFEQVEKSMRSQAKEIRTDETLDASTKMEKLKALKTSHKASIEAILTPAQLEKQSQLKAQHKEEREAHRAEMKAKMDAVDKEGLKEELKAYRDENIKPVMLSQRQKLESEISEIDKQEIESLRTVFKAQKEEMRQERKARKEKMESGEKPSEEAREAKREAMMAKKEAMKPYMEKAKALADKYDEEINSLLEEVKPQAETWKAEQKSIKEKYLGDLMNEKRAHHPHHGKGHHERGERGEKGHHGKESHGKGHHGKHPGKGNKKVKFLLMDLNEETSEQSTDLPQISNINVFPNPSGIRNTIQFQVEKAGTVLIEIHDQSGNVVQRVSQKYLEPGVYREEVNLGGLRESVYYYVISDQSGVISEKFVKLP